MKRDSESMREFWNTKARENATYYVSSYRPYDDQNLDEFFAWGEKLAGQFLEESGIAFTGSERVLEIGCGIGRMTRYFAGRFKEVHGVDVAPEMISQASENLKSHDNVTLHVGNGYDLAFLDDRSFDFAFSYITLQHIPSADITENYIREAGRVLQPGGHFYFQVNNVPNTFRSRLRLRTRLRALLGREEAPPAGAAPTGLDRSAWRGSSLSLKQVERACGEGGLQVLGLNGEGSQYLWVKAVRR